MNISTRFAYLTALVSLWGFSTVAHGAEVACDVALASHIASADKPADVRLREAKSGLLRTASGAAIFTQVVAPANPGIPTLLLMPGVNRSVLASEPQVIKLAQAGFGVVSIQFSTQPFSVSSLPATEKPTFLVKDLTLKDFAEQTQTVIDQVKAEGMFGDVIPVSLSYSGAVSVQLKGFDLIVETVPMTSSDAANPEAAQYRNTLRAGELFNPFFGPMVTRSSLDSAYRTAFTPTAESIIKNFGLRADAKDTMVAGYSNMARATEGFDWSQVKIPEATRRIFILAAGDSKSLLTSQIETYRRLSQTHPNLLLIVVNESGHIIPADQPAAYASLMKYILIDKLAPVNGVMDLTPSTKKLRAISAQDAAKYLARVIDSAK